MVDYSKWDNLTLLDNPDSEAQQPRSKMADKVKKKSFDFSQAIHGGMNEAEERYQ